MSAFSRGCLLRHQCAFKTPRIVQFFPSTSYQQPRFFSSSSIMHKVKKAKKFQPSQPSKKVAPKNQPITVPAKTPTPARAPTPTQAPPPSGLSMPTYKSYVTSLAEKSSPTHLYEAPSHTAYMFTCYSSAGFCFTYAAVSFWSNYIQAPPDIAAWVPVALGGISFMMACLGTWLVLGPARLVKSISAVPRGVHMVKGALVQKGGPELRLEIELKKMFPVPFFPARKFSVRPEEIELEHRFVPISKRISMLEAKEQAKLEAEQKQKELEYERSHILTSPFRKMSQLLFEGFIVLRRSWTREGMMKVKIQGENYKMDIFSGWALDGGRALDRLAKIKP